MSAKNWQGPGWRLTANTLTIYAESDDGLPIALKFTPGWAVRNATTPAEVQDIIDRNIADGFFQAAGLPAGTYRRRAPAKRAKRAPAKRLTDTPAT